MKYSPKSKAAINMSRYMPPIYQQKLIKIATEIDNSDFRSQTLSELIKNYNDHVTNEQMYLLMVDLLQTLSKRPLEDFLSDLQALAPVFVRLGGQEAIDKVILELEEWEKTNG